MEELLQEEESQGNSLDLGDFSPYDLFLSVLLALPLGSGSYTYIQIKNNLFFIYFKT